MASQVFSIIIGSDLLKYDTDYEAVEFELNNIRLRIILECVSVPD